MIRLGCDSSRLASLMNTDFAFPYADLLTEAKMDALKKRLPGTEIVPIDRGLGDPMRQATILDIERGARRDVDAPAWWDEQHARGLDDLTVYVTLLNAPRVMQLMDGRPTWVIYAYWAGGLKVPDHPAAAIQFASGAMLGADVDLTLVHNDKWHRRQHGAAQGLMAETLAMAESIDRARDNVAHVLSLVGGTL